jgi:hypothetical protein
MVLRARWKSGPATETKDGAHVSVTEYRLKRRNDWLGVARSAMSLRRHWPGLEGAVGLWLWSDASFARVGSVSVWQASHNLRTFVGWEPHVQITRHYRTRGTLRSTDWRTTHFEPSETWLRALDWIKKPPTAP